MPMVARYRPSREPAGEPPVCRLAATSQVNNDFLTVLLSERTGFR